MRALLFLAAFAPCRQDSIALCGLCVWASKPPRLARGSANEFQRREFVDRIRILTGFVKMGKPRSPACENETEKRAQEGGALKDFNARNSKGSCGARLRRRAGSPAALAVVGWWQAPWSSAMRIARLWRGRSTDESTDESTTDEVHWTQVPAPPRGHAHVVAYLPHQCLQSRRNPIRNPISGSLHHIA